MTEEIPESVTNLKRDGTLRESFDWVFSQLALPEPEMSNCPCLGAFGMLEWASGHRSEFYKLAASLLAKEKQDSAGNIEQRVERHFKQIEKHGSRLLQGITRASEESGTQNTTTAKDLGEDSNQDQE